MALFFTLFGGLKNTHFFWQPSWIYANCKNCPKLTACHSSQIGSMTPIKDRETKNSMALNMSGQSLSLLAASYGLGNSDFWPCGGVSA